MVSKCPIILSGNIHAFQVTLLARPIRRLKLSLVLCRFTGVAYPLLSEVEIPIDHRTTQWGTTLMVSFRTK